MIAFTVSIAWWLIFPVALSALAVIGCTVVARSNGGATKHEALGFSIACALCLALIWGLVLCGAAA